MRRPPLAWAARRTLHGHLDVRELIIVIRRPPIEPPRTLQIALTLTLVLCAGVLLAVVAYRSADSTSGHEQDTDTDTGAPFSDEERRRLHTLREARQWRRSAA